MQLILKENIMQNFILRHTTYQKLCISIYIYFYKQCLVFVESLHSNFTLLVLLNCYQSEFVINPKMSLWAIKYTW